MDSSKLAVPRTYSFKEHVLPPVHEIYTTSEYENCVSLPSEDELQSKTDEAVPKKPKWLVRGELSDDVTAVDDMLNLRFVFLSLVA